MQEFCYLNSTITEYHRCKTKLVNGFLKQSEPFTIKKGIIISSKVSLSTHVCGCETSTTSAREEAFQDVILPKDNDNVLVGWIKFQMRKF